MTATWTSIDDYLESRGQLPGSGPDGVRDAAAPELVAALRIPFCSEADWLWSGKVALRYYNSHALVNIAVKLSFDQRPEAAAPPPAAGGAGDAQQHHSHHGRVAAAAVVVGHPQGRAAAPRLADGGSSSWQHDESTWVCGRARAAEAAVAGRRLGVKVGAP